MVKYEDDMSYSRIRLKKFLSKNPKEVIINPVALGPKCVTFINTNETNPTGITINDDTSDVILVVGDQSLVAHKDILALNCEYFNIMFTSCFKEKKQDVVKITIDFFSFETLKVLIEYFYTSTLKLTEHNVQDVLVCSNLFLIEDVQSVCVDYLKVMIDSKNCLDMKEFASTFRFKELYSLCINYIINNFGLVARNEAMLRCTYDEMEMFLTDENLFAKETLVYDVLLDWVKYDLCARYKISIELLWHVRLPMVLNTYQGNVRKQEFLGPKFDSVSQFRINSRKPFRQGILIITQYPVKSKADWYDYNLDQWHSCTFTGCHCKHFETALVPPRPFSTTILLESDNLLAVGGDYNNSGMKCVFLFDCSYHSWGPLPDMHHQRINPYVIQMKDKVFVVGGCNKLVPDNVMEYFDVKQNNWHIVKSCIYDASSLLRDESYAVGVNNLIYIIYTAGALYYDTENGTWDSIMQVPDMKYGSAICTLNNNIYLIGGRKDDVYYKSVWAFCTDTKVWVAIADMNTPRAFAGVTVMNGFIYVFGGETKLGVCLDNFEVYDPNVDEWVTSTVTMGVGKCYMDAIVLDKQDRLYIEEFENTISVIH